MKHSIGGLCLCAALGLLFSASAYAAVTGSIKGVVRDSEKNVPVGGVTVVVKSPATGEKVEITDDTGAFVIANLPVGPYSINADFAGASDQQTVVVEPNKAANVSLNLKMSMAKAEQYTIEVTGSLLGATAKDSPIPLYSRDRADARKQGDPTVLDQIKTLPIGGPVIGDSNPFNPDAQFRPGAGTINLRGLGAQRTLLLLNGKRFSPNNITAPDTNLLPASVIGRVEILKDGGAATYGSDAIAGVANFFTRQDINGFEFSADYRQVTGSAGDASVSGAWGKAWDGGNFLVSAGYQFRGELNSTDRAWAYQPYLKHPQSWSPYNNPGLWVIFGAFNGNIGPGQQLALDANCAQMGGAVGFAGNTPLCYNSFAPSYNLVNEQHQVQLYGEFNTKVGSKSKFHMDALYALTNQPSILVNASFPTINKYPNGAPFGPSYIVPASNPGFADFMTQTGNAALIPVAGGAVMGLWSPFGMGGNPDGDPNAFYSRRAYGKNEEMRASADLSGDLGLLDMHYRLGATYIVEEQLGSFGDILTARLQDALNGFGGPGCDPTTGTAGDIATGGNCQYLNPFSNGVAGNAVTGTPNPGFVPGNENSKELAHWLFDDPRELRNRTDMAVFDAFVDGEIPICLGGGKPTWGIGGQYRRTTVYTMIANPLANALATPCAIPGDTSCVVQTGPYVFSSGFVPRYADQGVYALFGQLDMPFFESLNSSFSLRFEDYGGLTGSTINPQFRAKWQIADFIALRGSIGTSFRGPTPYNVVPDVVATQLASLQAGGGGFIANDIRGNPNLKPERALTFNVGTLLNFGGFSATFDYWFYKIDDQITNVNQDLIGNSVVNAFGLVDCSSPLRDRFTIGTTDTCVPGTTTGRNITRVESQAVNGPSLMTTGVDAELDYRLKLFGGTLDLGAAASIVINYKQEAFVLDGVTLANAYDAVGYTNYDRLPGTIPRWRGNFFVNYNHGWHNFRVTTNYTDGATDNRGAFAVQTGPTGAITPTSVCTVANVAAGTATNCQVTDFGVTLPGFVSLDATYQLSLPWDMTVSVSALNIIGMDPPSARLPFGYDPFIGNPLGRMFKFAITQKF